MFQNGNRTGAMRWLRQAAEAGEARAMLLYGTALYNGDGLTPDPVIAYAYISRSAAQGLDVAQATLADLDQTMPLQQRQRGVALAKTMVAAQAPAAPKLATPKIASSAAKATPPMAISSPSGSGGWRIQLGAFGQRAAAEASFAKLRGKVGARQPYYVAAGKVVRLQVGPYDSRAAAVTGCAALGGQACFPVAAR